MAFKKTENFSFNIDESVNEVIDEGGNKYLALKKISYNNGPYRLDLRTWYINADGSERMGKGTPITEEGANNLARTLLKHGYCKTEEAIDELKTRDDFLSSLKNSLTEKDLEDVGIKINEIDPSQFYNPMDMDIYEDETEEETYERETRAAC